MINSALKIVSISEDLSNQEISISVVVLEFC